MNRQKRNANKSQGDPESLSPEEIWLGAKVTLASIAGFLFLFCVGVGIVWTISAYTNGNNLHLYEARELEILSYKPSPTGSNEDPKVITGILWPEGIEVTTSDDLVSLMSLNHSNSLVQMVPEESKVVGKRIQVSYFVGSAEEMRWWHPGTIHNRRPLSQQQWKQIRLFTFVSFLGMWGCFYYAYRVNLQFARLTAYKRR